MRCFAEQRGYDPEFWGIVGLLHDIDFEQWPEQHCVKAPELLREGGADESIIHAVCSHGWAICVDIKPCGGAHAPVQERAGHGAQEPEEEIQG